jgi:hypothetical protein
MILYHPAKDVNHCTYRMLSLLVNLDSNLTVEKLRLLDFYYAFPHFLKEIKPWPTDIKEFKKYTTKIDEPFEKITNKKRLFFEMTEIQKTSISLLHAKGLIKDSEFRSGKIVTTHDLIPLEMNELIKNDPFTNTNIFKTIVTALSKTPWEGKQGLKYRSGLLEYKYDE